MKRKIKSEAELVNALCKGVGVLDMYDEFVTMQSVLNFYSYHGYDALKGDIEDGDFQYAEPVEVVELWFNNIELDIDESATFTTNVKDAEILECTHKQTQIIQNGEIIWTETTKIKN